MAQFDIGEKALILIEYTFHMTTNRKRYPQKYVVLAKYIQNFSLDIYENACNANDIRLSENKKERQRLQTKVINLCDRMSKFVEMSMGLNLIKSDTVKNWQKLIGDVKYMTISWRAKEKDK